MTVGLADWYSRIPIARPRSRVNRGLDAPSERRAEARRLQRCVEARDQNVSRSPICPVLVDPTLVIWPKVGEVTVVFGLLYCRQLNTLNDSMRN